MKPSIYNSYFNFNDGIQMIYNAYTDKFVVFSSNVIINKANITDSNIINKEFYANVINSGCIIENEVDEVENVRNDIIKAYENDDYLHLTINPTLNCNFKCWYCYENHILDSKISSETILSIAKLISGALSKENNYKKVLISFFGGEPLMYFNDTVKPLILKVDEECKRYGKEFEIHFTSNAYLLNATTIQFLSHYTCSFQITLDGHRTRHDSVRYNGTFGSYDIIIANIISLAESGIRTLVRINCTKLNVNDLEKILYDFETKVKSDIRNFVSFDIQRVWQDIDADVNSESESNVNSVISKYIKLYQTSGFQINSVLIFNKIKSCCYGDKLHHATINYNGDVYQCTARDFNEKNRMGRLCSDGTIEWDKMTVRDRNSHKFSNPACHSCRIAPLCGGGCSQNAIEHKHNGKCIFGYTEEKIDEIILTRFRYMFMGSTC